MPLYTFSGAARAEACPGHAVYPHVRRTSPAARRGTVLHAFVARRLVAGEEVALAEVPEDMRADVAQFDCRGLPDDPGCYACEVAFAVDPETGIAREVGRNIDRAYAEAGVRDTEVAGAADFVALVGADGVDVSDLKTGYGAQARARDHAQLVELAAAAVRAYRRSWARVRLLVRRENGSDYFDTAELDAFDLDDAFARLQRSARGIARARAEAVNGEPRTLSEGPWCTYCPAIDSCRAKVSGLVALAQNPGGMLDDVVSRALTPERAADAVRALAAIKRDLGRAEGQVRAYAREVGGIDMGDGTVYGEHVVEHDEIDGATAYAILEELHGSEVARAACDFSTSKAGIERALTPIAPPRGRAAMVREVEARLRAAGGVVKVSKAKMEIYRIKV